MKYIFALLFTLASTNLFAGPSEIMSAACRINTDKSSGSGMVFKKDAQNYYVVTAGHVVDDATFITVQFFSDGIISHKIPSKLSFISFNPNSETQDVAVLHFPISSLGKHKITPIPVAPSEYYPKANDKICGAGCPEAKWLQYWETRILTVNQRMTFVMPPIGGQSGSGVVVTLNGKDYIVGLVNWRMEPPLQSMYGGGVLLNKTQRTTVQNAGVKKVNVREDKDICGICGLPKENHSARIQHDGTLVKDENGNPRIFCPRCAKHGLRYQEHLDKGMKPLEFCGPNGCFPFNDATPVPPASENPFAPETVPPQTTPPEEDAGLVRSLLERIGLLEKNVQEKDQVIQEKEKALEDSKNPLDDVTNGHGTAATGLGSYLLGIISAFVAKRFGKMPSWVVTFILKRHGKKVIEELKKKEETEKLLEVANILYKKFTDKDKPSEPPTTPAA